MIASNLTVNGVGRFLNTIYGNIAGAAGRLDGFSSGGAASSCSWGNQTGTAIYASSTPAGGGWAFRDNNPGSGQVSMVIDGTVYIKEGGVNVGDAVKSFSVSGKTVTYTTLWGNTGTFTTQDTTYTSQAAASGGTAVSLVTTGEKYTWNNKSNLTIGTTASTAAAGNHTHGLSLATDTGTSSISLAANTKYKLTAGGSTYIFTTPPDNNTTYTSQAAASGGTAVSLVTTGEKYTWNNKSNLTIGTTATTAAAGNHTHTIGITNTSAVSVTALAANTQYTLTAGGSYYSFTTPPDTNTTYQAGTGLTLSSNTFSLSASGVTAGSKGPTEAVTGTNNTSIYVPRITVDSYGRVTALAHYKLTNKDTTYSNKAAVKDGTATSLVLTGDKYRWNNMAPKTMTIFDGDFQFTDNTGVLYFEMDNSNTFLCAYIAKAWPTYTWVDADVTVCETNISTTSNVHSITIRTTTHQTYNLKVIGIYV